MHIFLLLLLFFDGNDGILDLLYIFSSDICWGVWKLLKIFSYFLFDYYCLPKLIKRMSKQKHRTNRFLVCIYFKILLLNKFIHRFSLIKDNFLNILCMLYIVLIFQLHIKNFFLINFLSIIYNYLYIKLK